MNNWIQIATFTLPQDAHLAKTKLESEGIQVVLKDELTTQVINYYSNAIGGVKLLVEKPEAKRAKQILKETNVNNIETSEPDSILIRINSFTERIPLVGRLILELRIVVLITLIIAAILVPIIILTLPSVPEKLTNGFWCLNEYYFQGKRYAPNTKEFITISYGDGCEETLSFFDFKASLPGFNSPKIESKWRISDNKLIIYQADTLSYLYEGEYEIQVDHNNLYLESDNVIIVATKHRISFW